MWPTLGSDGSFGEVFALGISLQVQGVSRWAGPIRDDKFAWDVQVHTMAYEAEPDEKIRPGSDALCVCNLRHRIRSVARVNKEGWCARLGMILRDMSSGTHASRGGHLAGGAPTPKLIPPMIPTLFNSFLYCSGTTY